MNTHLEHLARTGDAGALLALAREQWRRGNAVTLGALQTWVVDRMVALGQWLAVYPAAASYWLKSNVRAWFGEPDYGPYSWADCVLTDSRHASWVYGWLVFNEQKSWHCVWVRLLHHLRYALRDTWPGGPP